MAHQELDFSETQKRVIAHDKGHLRIVAGPGSGKTEIVSQRVAELISKGVPPSEIVAFTFTKKAAEELKLRIRRIVEDKCKDNSKFGEMYIGTIDSFCLHLLKKIKPEYCSFEVLDEQRRAAFVDRWYYILDLKKLEAEKKGKWKTAEKFCRSSDRVMMERIDIDKVSNKDFVKSYKAYRKKLEEEKFFDFTSVIFDLLEVLKKEKSALEDSKYIIKHVVFDEYQDVNMLQEELLEQLSKGSSSVCVVGDDDQNIFQWRGSNVNYIKNFPEKYREYGVKTETLDVNYRATDALVSTAEKLIKHDTSRIKKNMKHDDKQVRKFERGDIVHHHFDTDHEEFDYILETIKSLEGTDFTEKYGETYALSYNDMAVLVRTNEDAERIVRFLKQNKIHCIADSGTSVFQRPLVEFAIDCIGFVFGNAAYAPRKVPEMEELTDRYADMLNGNAEQFRKKLLAIKKRADRIIDKGDSDWLPDLGLQEFYHRILNAMGAEEGVLEPEDLNYLAVLSKAISDYEYVYQTLKADEVAGLGWYISQFAKSKYSDPKYENPAKLEGVRVLTIWKAKGLEFPVVFVPNFVQKRTRKSEEVFVDSELYNVERYDGNEKDKRRAVYTAITRSQKYLFLTGSKKIKNTVKWDPPDTIYAPDNFLKQMKNGVFSPLVHVSKPKSSKKHQEASNGVFPTSYSDLNIYERCPYDYQLRHVYGFSAGVPAPYGYGTNIHNIINRIHSDYIKDKKHKKIPNDKELKEIFDRMFYLRFAPGKQNENFKKAGYKVVKSYVDLHKKDFERILETEKRFEFVMGKAMISGDIDLLKKENDEGEITEVEIIDFKTDKEKEDGKYELDYSEQVRFYAYATKKSLGKMPVKAVIHHLETHEKVEVDISDEKLEQTKSRIEKNVDKILGENFTATPEKMKCVGCDFRAICSQKGFDVGVDFTATKSSKRKGTMRPAGEISEMKVRKEKRVVKKIASKGIMKGADEILAAKKIIQISENEFQAESRSDPKKKYKVTDTRCECSGFRYRGTCAHFEAGKLLKNQNRLANLSS